MPKPSENVRRFARLDEAVQDDVLLWSQWEPEDWANDVIETINDGGYDDMLAKIVVAANARMASVFKGWNDTSQRVGGDRDTALALGSRLDGMKHAATIVKDLGLTMDFTQKIWRKTKKGERKQVEVIRQRPMPTTRENYAEIIERYGDKHEKYLAEKAAEEAGPKPKRRRKKIIPGLDEAAAKTVTPSEDDGPVHKTEYRPSSVMAKSVRPGDRFDGKEITDIEKVGASSVRFVTGKAQTKTFRLTTKVEVERPVIGKRK